MRFDPKVQTQPHQIFLFGNIFQFGFLKFTNWNGWTSPFSELRTSIYLFTNFLLRLWNDLCSAEAGAKRQDNLNALFNFNFSLRAIARERSPYRSPCQAWARSFRQGWPGHHNRGACCIQHERNQELHIIFVMPWPIPEPVRTYAPIFIVKVNPKTIFYACTSLVPLLNLCSVISCIVYAPLYFAFSAFDVINRNDSWLVDW